MSEVQVLESRHLWVMPQAAGVSLEGDMRLPAQPRGLVVFPHNSGIRRGPRDGVVAQLLREEGLATLLITLLTNQEQLPDSRIACFRFDTKLLAERLVGLADWLAKEPTTRDLAMGYFCGGSGSAGLLSAVQRPELIRAIVLHNSAFDVAAVEPRQVKTPTLIIVGGDEEPQVGESDLLFEQLGAADKQLSPVPMAAMGPDKPGGLEEVARLASEWFGKHLGAKSKASNQTSAASVVG